MQHQSGWARSSSFFNQVDLAKKYFAHLRMNNVKPLEKKKRESGSGSSHGSVAPGSSGQEIFIKIHHCLSVRFDLTAHHGAD